MSSPSSLFRRGSPSVPAAVLLFLIENSGRMERRWEKLREDHLEPLLAIFEEANTDVPVRVMTLESVPLGGEAPRIYPTSRESLRGVQFNPVEGNTLTADKIERAAQLLGTFKYRGQAVDAHLVVVAATDPSPEVPAGIKQYPWFLAAKEIVSNNALCHLALIKDGQDISPFVGMFKNTLWLQDCEEVPSPFEYDGGTYAFHFCFKSSAQSETSSRSISLISNQEDRRAERSRRYSGDAFPSTSSRRHRDSEDQSSITQAMMHYDDFANRSAGASTRASAPSQNSLSPRAQGVRPRSSRVGIAQLVDGPIHLPSVPEIPPVGVSQHVVEPSGPGMSSSSSTPGAGLAPPASVAQGRRSSFMDDIFSPSNRDSHTDIDEDTEAFWMEGRALDEALMRFGKDGAK
ncbi:hypothetical protein BKA70DRAFT_1269281 [Coprinopsis sp. MPI-PUGE-AT-0042]|nr:hypothetical protein BKA70DRAFT_1269281 [Coprinopsis sp. MPI-PUGE-AT-0042]